MSRILTGSIQSRLRVLLCGIMLLVGCTTIRETQPPRTATEQLMLSRSVTMAIGQLDLSKLNGKTVYIDITYFKSYDQEFVLGEFNAQLRKEGAIVTSLEDATIVVEIRSGGLGINRKDTVFGIPSLPIPIPGAGIFTTPELAFLKESKQLGLMEVAIVAYTKDSRDLVFASQPSIGQALIHDWSFFSTL